MDVGLLVARLMLGLALGAHGAQKLFGWFGGHGLLGTAGFFEGLGFPPGALFALVTLAFADPARFPPGRAPDGRGLGTTECATAG